jgi:hypothetical protein
MKGCRIMSYKTMLENENDKLQTKLDILTETIVNLGCLVGCSTCVERGSCKVFLIRTPKVYDIKREDKCKIQQKLFTSQQN